MPYSIDRYNGTQLTVVEDGTIDSTLDIKLIGKNYAGYGEAQNENFVHLLENFSNPTAPPRPMTGQLWFDSSAKILKVYAGDNKWKSASGTEVSATTPTGLTTGDLWLKKTSSSDKGQLYIHNGTDFTLVGPDAVDGFGITQFKSRVVGDSTGGNHAIIECIINDETVYIISRTEFTLATGQIASGGFTKVKEGLTLAYTQETNTSSLTYGATDINLTDNEPKFSFWGTASNSLRLNGKKDTDFASATNTIFTGLVRFYDPGILIGNDQDLAIYIDGGTIPTFKNSVGNLIRFATTQAGTKFPMELSGSDILPGYDPSGAPTTGVNNIGSSSRKFNIVDANSFTGNAAGANTLLVNTTYRSASTSAGANTVAARDSNGDLYAGVFNGVATSARYADLAEKFLADQTYSVGTVLVVGGSKEVTKASLGQRAVGVVSDMPAYVMNSELENGTLVALKGRVPVRVIGSIMKGDKLVAVDNGLAMKSLVNSSDVFAIALESSEDHSEKLIESIIL